MPHDSVLRWTPLKAEGHATTNDNYERTTDIVSFFLTTKKKKKKRKKNLSVEMKAMAKRQGGS